MIQTPILNQIEIIVFDVMPYKQACQGRLSQKNLAIYNSSQLDPDVWWHTITSRDLTMGNVLTWSYV